MTSSRIENIDQLRAEIKRLEQVAAGHKSGMKDGLHALQERLKPENILVNSLSSLTGITINKNEFLKHGIAVGLSLVLQRFIFKTEASLERKLYSWIDKLFDQVKYYTNKFSSAGSVGSEKIEDDQA